jgi:hypothetical protein
MQNTVTKYAGEFVYTNSYLSGATVPAETLEFIAQEEGRIRPEKVDTTHSLTAANTKYIYDYFMKDHLGNTRMVLTTKQQTDLYAATQEPANGPGIILKVMAGDIISISTKAWYNTTAQSPRSTSELRPPAPRYEAGY